jgi:hypothetical protein
MRTYIIQEQLEKLVDFNSATLRIEDALRATQKDEGKLLTFMRDYAAWNSYFAAGVTQLVTNIAGSQDIFMEQGQPYALADRSSYIASFFFDAARDEYDDHINRQRDPHRSLAQAMLSAMSGRVHDGADILDQREPDWVQSLIEVVVASYNGGQWKNGYGPDAAVAKVFYGIGYHLGSEMLADQEFTIIDRFIREEMTPLFQYLRGTEVHFADADHRAYSWIGVHSSLGGAAEADHFAWALEGVNKALQFLPNQELQYVAVRTLQQGFSAFNADHERFFRTASTSL